MSLNEQLEKMREASWGSWPAEKRELMYRACDELARSGVLERALKKGQTAPDFTLPAGDGTQVTLSGLLAGGPVVLTFYRGHW